MITVGPYLTGQIHDKREGISVDETVVVTVRVDSPAVSTLVSFGGDILGDTASLTVTFTAHHEALKEFKNRRLTAGTVVKYTWYAS